MATGGLAEAGMLVAIVKTLFDITKTGFDLRGKRTEKANETIAKLKHRMLQLHDQLKSCGTLGRLVPDWLARSERFFFSDVNLLNDQDMLRLSQDLTHFISATRHDSFSSAFFTAEHNLLPEVQETNTRFGAAFQGLEEEVRHIEPRADPAAWRAKWPKLLPRLSDMQRQAQTLASQAAKAESLLLGELKQAAAVTQ